MSVYFITAREAGTVKIGNSLEPHGRLRELQTSCPHKLKLEAMIPGAFAEEGDLHWRFSEARIHGEWFALTPEIEALIAANPPRSAPTNARVSKAKPAKPPIIFGETARQYDERIEREKLAIVQAAGKRWLEQEAEAGRITFPFRAKADA